MCHPLTHTLSLTYFYFMYIGILSQVLGPLERELQTAVSSHMDARN